MSYSETTNLFLTIIFSFVMFLIFPKDNLKALAITGCLSIAGIFAFFFLMDFLFSDSALGKGTLQSAFTWQIFSGKSIYADGVYGVLVGVCARLFWPGENENSGTDETLEDNESRSDLFESSRRSIKFQWWAILIAIVLAGFLEYVLPWIRQGK